MAILKRIIRYSTIAAVIGHEDSTLAGRITITYISLLALWYRGTFLVQLLWLNFGIAFVGGPTSRLKYIELQCTSKPVNKS